MATLPRDERYSTVAIWFHWAIAAMAILNLVIGLFHESLLAGWKGSIGIHKAVGITVLVLTAGRILWRLAHRPPILPANVAGWERGVAHAAHWGLYALLFIMPLTGWAMSSGPKRYPLTWFGLFDIPYLPVSAGTAGFSHEAHEVLGFLMAGLVVIHVAAALRHHFILRDRVLARMLPSAARR